MLYNLRCIANVFSMSDPDRPLCMEWTFEVGPEQAPVLCHRPPGLSPTGTLSLSPRARDPGPGSPRNLPRGFGATLKKSQTFFVKCFLNLFAPIREWGASGIDKADPRTDLSDRWSQNKCGPVVKPTKKRPEPWLKPKRKPMGRTSSGLNVPPRFI